MTLRVYNTIARKKQVFESREPGKVAMYVCGPTVYNYIHIGNARCYLSFDVVKRYLKYKGYEVFHVQNFTDVDDKIIDQAKREGVSTTEVAAKYTQAFIEDSLALNIDQPDLMPKATEHINDMITTIQELVDRDYAYEVDGNVFFEVAKFNEYGRLSKRNLEEMQAGARVDVDKRKRHPMDFALWKKAKEGEPKWPSPWSEGRPGWHIECSVMSVKYLGISFDIHAGGQDLIFPHHENEIAQTECATGKQPFVRYWLHNGFVTMSGDKMAKSVGNIVSLRDALKRYDPHVIRLLFLTTHYRSPIDFSEAKLKEAASSLERLNNLLGNIDRILDEKEDIVSKLDSKSDIEGLGGLVSTMGRQFVEAMDDDFNAPEGLSVLFKAARDINTYLAAHKKLSLDELDVLEDLKDIFVTLGGALGLEFSSYLTLDSIDKEWREARKLSLIRGVEKCFGEKDKEIIALYDDFPAFIQKFVDLRAKKREEKDWPAADSIRGFLSAQDIILEDTKAGTQIRVKKVM